MMKKIYSSLTLILSILASPLIAADSSQVLVEDDSSSLIPQVRCPVMGGIIDSSFYTDIQGQRIYHCCGGCSEKLTADPENYFKKAATQKILFENIQTKCPVNGQSTDKTIYLDYEGRRIYFASEKCSDKFLNDPKKYLDKLDKQTHEHNQKGHDAKHDSHEGHDKNHGGCGM